MAVFSLPAAAHAAADDPWVAYVANSVVTKDNRQAAVILRVDPATGALVEVSRNSPQQGNLFLHPYDVALAPGGGRLYVADMGTYATATSAPADGRIIRVDPATGRQSLISQGGQLVDPAGIAVGPDGSIYVVENVGVAPARNPAVIRIDPATGAQTVITSGDLLCYPFGIALDAQGRILISNFGDLDVTVPDLECLYDAGSLIRLRPGSSQELLSVNQAGNNLFRGPLGVALAPGGDILVVNQTSSAAAVAAVNPVTGVQRIVTPNGSGTDAFELPQRVAVAPDGNLVVSDYALDDDEGGLVRVNRASGAAQLLRKGDLFNNPIGLALVVNRPPSAALAVAPDRVKGSQAVTFDASGSGDPEGLPLRYDWDLDGNGSFETNTGTLPRAVRAFEASTTLVPRVRVSDPHGGQAVAAAPRRLVVDSIRPVLSGFGVSARRLAVPRAAAGKTATKALRFRFRLSEAARVAIEIRRKLPGRRAGKRCVTPARARRRAPRCTRWPRSATLRKSSRAGAGSIRFSGRVRRRPLPVGRYKAIAVAVDEVGNRSKPRRLVVKIVPKSR